MVEHSPRDIARDVAVVTTAIVNAYLIGTRADWILVDTGLPSFAGTIRRAAERRFGPGARPRAILLTHGHFDHAGSAQSLAQHWGVPVYAHPLERPFLTGRAIYPPYDVTAPGFFALASRTFPRSSTARLDARLRDLETGPDTLDLADWAVVHTPGHCAGHVSLFRAQDGTLIAGDSLATVDLDSLPAVVSQEPRLSRPPTPATTDWGAAARSVALLASLRPTLVAAGHGKPMSGVADQLQAFSRAFPVPERGRYAHAPAVTDENGIVALPPAPPDFMPWVAGGLLAAGLATVLATRAAAPSKEN